MAIYLNTLIDKLSVWYYEGSMLRLLGVMARGDVRIQEGLRLYYRGQVDSNRLMGEYLFRMSSEERAEMEAILIQRDLTDSEVDSTVNRAQERRYRGGII